LWVLHYVNGIDVLRRVLAARVGERFSKKCANSSRRLKPTGTIRLMQVKLSARTFDNAKSVFGLSEPYR
jgi:hypothetical protein